MVNLRLELGFAIGPEVHRTLDYAIQANGDEPIRYQAHWPDGHQSHWPEGRWRTLHFPLPTGAESCPVRITFIVDNPVSTRVLHGAESGDDRIIGIELLRASYDLAMV